MQNRELSLRITSELRLFEGNMYAFPYHALLKTIGIMPEHAMTLIPFLHRDREYLAIPGKIIRIHNYGGELRDSEVTTSHPLHAGYQATLPEIPLLALDLRHGFPPHFSELTGLADMCIVNHGIILDSFDSHDPQATRRYLTSIGSVVKLGALLMIFASEYEHEYTPNKIASLIGATPFSDEISTPAYEALRRAGLPYRRTLDRQDGHLYLTNFLKLPESHAESSVYLYRNENT